MTYDCFSAPADIVTRLRSTESRSKRELLDEAAAEIERMREQFGIFEQFKWIPVTERLPDTMQDKSPNSGWSCEFAPTDDVLCLIGDENRMTVAWYSYAYNEWTTADERTVYQYGEITHWMPLPERPEVEA